MGAAEALRALGHSRLAVGDNGAEKPRDWAPHVTVAAVAQRDDRFLIVEELSRQRRVLNQPAGHLEDREALVDAVVREVREETAWMFHPEYIVGLYRWRNRDDTTHLRVAFYGTVTAHLLEQPLDDGILNAEWLSYDEIKQREAQHRSPLVMQCIDDYLTGRQYELDLLRDIGP